jgi:hypothetical protein
VPDEPHFSAKIARHEEVRHPEARHRIILAKRRVQSILDREPSHTERHLSRKFQNRVPDDQRVDPHLVGLAITDLFELRRLRSHAHPATGARSPWHSNLTTPDEAIAKRLEELAPLYGAISGHGFGNLTGDALEIIVFKCLDAVYAEEKQFPFLGAYHLAEGKTEQGRFRKTQPPRHIGGKSTQKEADFIQFGHPAGPLCIECKNYREWIYPHHDIIKELIVKAADLDAIPVLIARRIHYTAIRNLLEPAGIIAHETYYQYFPSDQHELAAKARDKRMLGFTDVVASETPHARTEKFFRKLLPTVVPVMAQRWYQNQGALVEYARGNINLPQLYTKIGSPAGGKWQDFSKPDEIGS